MSYSCAFALAMAVLALLQTVHANPYCCGRTTCCTTVPTICGPQTTCCSSPQCCTICAPIARGSGLGAHGLGAHGLGGLGGAGLGGAGLGGIGLGGAGCGCGCGKVITCLPAIPACGCVGSCSPAYLGASGCGCGCGCGLGCGCGCGQCWY